MNFSAFVSVAALTVGMAAFASGGAQAGSVDISGLTNSDIQTYTAGNNYPQGGSTVAVNGVNFLLTTDQGVASTTGVMQTSGSGTTFSPISVNQGDVTNVYTLINSAYGAYGATVGSLTFTDAANYSVTFDLVEGTNIRDHYNGFYNNTATDLFGTAQFNGGVRLDAQDFVLPSQFASSPLTTITFSGGTGNGEPFLAAVTVSSAVPEPATWAMMLLGFAGLGFAGYRRSWSQRVASAEV